MLLVGLAVTISNGPGLQVGAADNSADVKVQLVELKIKAVIK